MINDKNLYELLNVESHASIEEIKTSFRKLALRCHPDKNNNSKESQVLFQVIYNAYTTLTSEEKRKEYDTYLKTSSVITNKSACSGFKPGSIEYVCHQFNFILWEIEDILNATKKTGHIKVYSGHTIHTWLMKILIFIDKWVLEPAGYGDYFYEARNIKDKKVSDFLENGFNSKTHQPYANIYDYFYQIRKRMNTFIGNITTKDILQPIPDSPVTLLDCIFESQKLSYHYLGSLNLIIKKELSSITRFNHTHKCFDSSHRELLPKSDEI